MRIQILVVAIGVAAAGSAFAAVQEAPSGAQAVEKPSSPIMLSEDQQDSYDRWPADRQAAYDNWPGDVQAYIWTLSPERRPLFWELADNDKLAMVAMSEPDREAAWQILERRAAMALEQPPAIAEPVPVEPEEPQ